MEADPKKSIEPTTQDAVNPTVSDSSNPADAVSNSSGSAVCPNCQATLSGPYCAICGQKQTNLNRQVWSLVGDLLGDVLSLDSRVARTLIALAFRPGHLTVEYFAGRRARYTPPVRLYLVISFLFFVLMPAFAQWESVESLNTDPDTQINIDQDHGWAEELTTDIPALSQEEVTRLAENLKTQIKKAIEQYEKDPFTLYNQLMDMMSVVMFFLLPVFAMLLKLAYLGHGIYYAEHLLLAVHNHCFLFIALLLSATLELFTVGIPGLLTDIVDSLLQLWIPVYFFMSMLKTYQQGIGITVFKYTCLVLSYFSLMLFGLIIAAVVGVLTL